MRLVSMSSALAVLALTSALAQSPDRFRNPTPPATSRDAPAPGPKEQNAAGMPAAHRENPADHRFIIEAASAGRAETELARLAEQKADSEAVRAFARQMIRDHGQTNSALDQLTEGGPALQPDAERRQIRDVLSNLSGPEFDIEYLRLQVGAHQRMAQLMEYEIGSGADVQVQRFASGALPKVFTHLAMARRLLDQVSTHNLQIAAAPPRKASGMPTPQTPRANAN